MMVPPPGEGGVVSKDREYQFRMEVGQQKNLDNSAIATRGGPSVLVESRLQSTRLAHVQSLQQKGSDR